jgi:hypothetical protein
MAKPERHCNRRRAEDYREQPFGQEERRVHRSAPSPRLSRKTASSSSNLAMRAFNCAISRAASRFTLENPRPRRKFGKKVVTKILKEFRYSFRIFWGHTSPHWEVQMAKITKTSRPGALKELLKKKGTSQGDASQKTNTDQKTLLKINRGEEVKLEALHDQEVEFYAFDILVSDAEDIRKLPLSLRETKLARLLARRVDGIFLSDFEQGEIGPDLFLPRLLDGERDPLPCPASASQRRSRAVVFLAADDALGERLAVSGVT